MADIRVALLSILDQKSLLTKPLSYFIRNSLDMGYKGFEVQPPRFFFPIGFQLRYANLTWEEKALIRSLHQSFRSERWPWQWMTHVRKKDALKAYIVFDYRTKSPKDLRRIMKNLGHEVPVVLYPSHPGEKPVTRFDFQEMLIQPSLGWVQTHWISNPKDYIEVIRRSGFHGLALDTAHIQSCQTYFRMPMDFLIKTLFSYIYEVHISLSREVGDDKETLHILEILKNYGYRGPYVVETAPNPDVGFHKRLTEDLQKILI